MKKCIFIAGFILALSLSAAYALGPKMDFGMGGGGYAPFDGESVTFGATSLEFTAENLTF